VNFISLFGSKKNTLIASRVKIITGMLEGYDDLKEDIIVPAIEADVDEVDKLNITDQKAL
jgi:hypothetical protein